MINRSNENKIRYLSYLFFILIVFDLLTIISNIYIAPVLEGLGMPDILIYIKLLITVISYITLFRWLRDDHVRLSLKTVRMLIYATLIVSVSYFLSLYLYKYHLIDTVTNIIGTQIIGNSSNTNLIIDLSRRNYQSLSYIITLFNGFNSELILFLQAFLLQMFLYKTNDYELSDEKLVQYDDFLYKHKLIYVSIIHFLLTFLSINLFQFRYDLIESVEMGIAFALFALGFVQMVSAIQITNTRNKRTLQSNFAGAYKRIIVSMMLSVILTVLLIGINIYYITVGIGNYRIVTTFMLLLTFAYILVTSIRVLKFENK